MPRRKCLLVIGNVMILGCLLGVLLAVPCAQPIAAVPVVHPHGDYVKVNGAKIWYESEGSGEPLLLIAGGPGFSHSYFHPYFSTLANSFRVIYFDAFGRGKSDRAKNPVEYTFMSSGQWRGSEGHAQNYAAAYSSQNSLFFCARHCII